jgi:hypothetical protein
MATVQAPGGGIIDSGDKRIERRVVVSTSGRPSAPGGTGRLTGVSITEEPGGVQRGVFEYTQGGQGDANYNQFGKKIELVGGTRDVPIAKHPNFNGLSAQQIADVQKAVENKDQNVTFSGPQDNLYQCLIRKIEYYLAPSLVARISEIESTIPSTAGLARVASPQGVTAPPNTRWLVTGISAAPLGDRYEVTREYTLVQDPQATEFLYS